MAVWKPWNVSVGTALCCEDETVSENSIQCNKICLCLFQMRWICQPTSPATCPLRVLCQSRRKATATPRLAATSSSCLRSPMDTSIRAQMVSNLSHGFGEGFLPCLTNPLSQRHERCYFYSVVFWLSRIIILWYLWHRLWFITTITMIMSRDWFNKCGFLLHDISTHRICYSYHRWTAHIRKVYVHTSFPLLFRIWYVLGKQQIPLYYSELFLFRNVAFSDLNMWDMQILVRF